MSPTGSVLIDCGPAVVDIDQVRAITNFSTGALGGMLADAFAEQGWQVRCLVGVAATAFHANSTPSKVRNFRSNDDLWKLLEEEAMQHPPDLLLHAAALSDFVVDEVISGESGSALSRSGKICSSTTGFTIRMKPAEKLIAKLRPLFPRTTIIGWKFEVSVSPEELFEKAVEQIQSHALDGCVANGPAIGSQLSLVSADGSRADFPDRKEFCSALPQLFASRA